MRKPQQMFTVKIEDRTQTTGLNVLCARNNVIKYFSKEIACQKFEQIKSHAYFFQEKNRILYTCYTVHILKMLKQNSEFQKMDYFTRSRCCHWLLASWHFMMGNQSIVWKHLDTGHYCTSKNKNQKCCLVLYQWHPNQFFSCAQPKSNP